MNFIIKLINVFDLYTERKIFLKLNQLLGKDIKQVIDVGAHQGEFIVKLSKFFNIKNALSFEPNPKVFKILNNKTNDLQNKNILKTINLAIGENSKTEILNVNLDSSSSSINKLNEESNYFIRKYRVLNFFKNKKITKPVQIRVEKLSDILNKYEVNEIDLLKIDTQGFEPEVLKGFESKLSTVKVVLCELMFYDFYDRSLSFSDIEKFLLPFGFKLYDISHISKNPMNGRTDWVDVIYLRN